MTGSQRSIIKGYCWSATGLGLVLGPGADAVPLLLLWGAGVMHLATDGDVSIDETEAKAAVAAIVAALGAWFVSGKIAQIVAGALVTAAVGGFFASFGTSALLGILAALGLNATINALFTYRFLSALAAIIGDADASHTIFLKAFINVITDQLLSIVEIPRDLLRTARLMTVGI